MTELDHETVGQQLARVLVSKRLVGSPSLSRFLRYVVDAALAGRTDGLKEAVLGIEVFGRGPGFDPRLDPIVRVQAAKLRARLEEYYAGEGATDPLIIEIPRGTYVPAFHLRESLEPAGEPARRRPWLRWAAVVVLVVGTAGAIRWATWRGEARPRYSVRQLTFDSGSTTFPAVSRDGVWLAYASDRADGANMDIWVQRLAGGDPVRITRNQAADITPDFSPDGSRIVFRSHRDGGGIYLASVPGGGEQKLVSDGWLPRFSPRGDAIVYQGVSQRPGGDLYVMPAAGGEPRLVPIGSEVTLIGYPVWTPDGNSLLFTGARRGERDLWMVRARGGVPAKTGLADALRQRGPEGVEPRPGDWDGNRLVFSLSGKDAGGIGQVEFSPDGWRIVGAPQQITYGSALEESPHLAPGSRIVFSSLVQRTHLWALPLRAGKISGAPVQLTRHVSLPPGNSRDVPRFSANAKVLAYTSERTGNRDIWLQNLADGSSVAITSNRWTEEHPLLSPDGRQVAFASRQSGRISLQVAELPSARIRATFADCGAPADWVAGGQRFLYIGGQEHAVFELDLTTGNRREILRKADLRFRHAALSPNGEWLSLTADGEPTFLVRFAKDGSLEHSTGNVLIPDRSVESVHWSPDGGTLYFFSERDDFRCLWSQPVNRSTGEPAGRPIAVHHFHSRRRPWSTWISVDATKLVVRLTEPLSNIFLASR